MDTHTIATQLVCAWLSRTEVETIGFGEAAARETGEFIAGVFSAVVEGLESGTLSSGNPPRFGGNNVVTAPSRTPMDKGVYKWQLI